MATTKSMSLVARGTPSRELATLPPTNYSPPTASIAAATSSATSRASCTMTLTSRRLEPNRRAARRHLGRRGERSTAPAVLVRSPWETVRGCPPAPSRAPLGSTSWRRRADAPGARSEGARGSGRPLRARCRTRAEGSTSGASGGNLAAPLDRSSVQSIDLRRTPTRRADARDRQDEVFERSHQSSPKRPNQALHADGARLGETTSCMLFVADRLVRAPRVKPMALHCDLPIR
jgi:hypothetical protein